MLWFVWHNKFHKALYFCGKCRFRGVEVFGCFLSLVKIRPPKPKHAPHAVDGEHYSAFKAVKTDPSSRFIVRPVFFFFFFFFSKNSNWYPFPKASLLKISKNQGKNQLEFFNCFQSKTSFFKVRQTNGFSFISL